MSISNELDARFNSATYERAKEFLEKKNGANDQNHPALNELIRVAKEKETKERIVDQEGATAAIDNFSMGETLVKSKPPAKDSQKANEAMKPAYSPAKDSQKANE